MSTVVYVHSNPTAITISWCKNLVVLTRKFREVLD